MPAEFWADYQGGLAKRHAVRSRPANHDDIGERYAKGRSSSVYVRSVRRRWEGRCGLRWKLLMLRLEGLELACPGTSKEDYV
jgi:hypothetical protein